MTKIEELTNKGLVWLLSIIGTLTVTGLISVVIFAGKSYADDEYVNEKELIEVQIDQLDNRLFEIEQDLIFRGSDEEARKLGALKGHYEAAKAKLIRERDDQDKK